MTHQCPHMRHSKNGKLFHAGRGNPKDMSYQQLKRKINIAPLDDYDGDGVPNYRDCKPLDKKRQDVETQEQRDRKKAELWDWWTSETDRLRREYEESDDPTKNPWYAVNSEMVEKLILNEDLTTKGEVMQYLKDMGLIEDDSTKIKEFKFHDMKGPYSDDAKADEAIRLGAVDVNLKSEDNVISWVADGFKSMDEAVEFSNYLEKDSFFEPDLFPIRIIRNPDGTFRVRYI